ncbi:MAG: histidinol-phosphatase [Thermoanaerobaculia bacterium]
MCSRSLALLPILTLAAGVSAAQPPEPAARWWKGNLHTHSLWSDGDDYPEMILDWYKANGYHFAALSDHNVLNQGERWIDLESAGGSAVLSKYKERFGDEWVEETERNGTHFVRLKTFLEYRSLFEEPGRFLVIQNEEITDRFEKKPVHVNATNLRELVEPQGGTSVSDVMQRNVDAVLEQRERTGQLMFPHINHPNSGWAVKVEDLIALRGERFFEVYNGHPAVRNEGDAAHPSTERIWDILLAERLSGGKDVMYGLAVDDSHDYHEFGPEHVNPGRGWVMVRANALDAEALIRAMEAGDFYGSSGVTLDAIDASNEGLSLTIRAEPGVEYRTEFIGTRWGYDRARVEVPIEEEDGASVLYGYSDQIGEVLAEVSGVEPSYDFRGNEIYVRARVVSTRLKKNPYSEGEFETAWVQPLVITP